MDACRPMILKVDGDDVIRPESHVWLGGLDAGGYFTGGEFHSLMLESVEMSDGASACLGGGGWMRCELSVE